MRGEHRPAGGMRPAAGWLTWRKVGLLALALLVGLGFRLMQPAYAAFSVTDSDAANGWQAATLQPVSNLTAVQTCNAGSPTITLSWTASSSTWASGYQVARSGATTQTIAYGTNTATDTAVTGFTAYTWTVSAYYGANWISTTVSTTLTTYLCMNAPNPTSGAVGSSVTLTGSGFRQSKALTVTFGSTAATITSGGTSDGSGAVAVTFTVPFSGNGSYAITVSDGVRTGLASGNFTVTGSFDGVMFTNITKSGAGVSTCTTPTISQNTSCTAGGLGGTGSFTGSVTFVTSAAVAVTNTDATFTVTSANTTVSGPGATVTPASSTIANGATSTASGFTMTGKGAGWKATMTCSVTVNGITYTTAVTGS